MSVVKNTRKKISMMSTPLLLDTMKEAMILLDENKQFLQANNAAFILFPELKKCKIAKPVKEGECLDLLRTQIPSWSQDCSFCMNYEVDGIKRHYDIRSTCMKSRGKIIGWLILVYDETKIMNQIEELEELVFTDVLTGVGNRRYFMEQAEREFSRFEREKKEMCLMILDIDRFKNVNDTYGHQAGDEVLRQMANIVKNTLRPYDLFARFGGEEFVILVTDTKQVNGMKIAERVRRSIEAADMAWQDVTIKITVSVGVAAVKKENCSLSEAIHYADMKLLEAKGSGRNNVKSIEVP